ncbi:gamma-glutamyltranspeptidase [Ramicandelaber brevisporus]|nr:gamma-glutamyltranspeptidase [Ramicandelaber brevisporus]
MARFKVFAVALTVAALATSGIADASSSAILAKRADTPDNSTVVSSKFAEGTHGVVAAEEATCSQIGVDVLKDGGSASDAAIAAALCTGTINSFSSGIGGGGFMLVRPAPTSKQSGNTQATAIDYRETAPAASTKDMYYKNGTLSQRGGLASGVPGEVRGYAAAHKRFGKVSWARLFEPSIKLANEGFKCSAVMRQRLTAYNTSVFGNKEFEAIFAPNGKLLEEGDLIVRKNYGETLKRIATQGPDAFYTGQIAQHIVDKIRATGGILTMKDMASYEAVVRPAVTGTYRGMKIFTTPPPTSGTVLLNILNILEGFPLNLGGNTSYGLEEHLLTEAFKHGNAQRTRLADPAFVNIEADVQRMTNKVFASQQRANISFDHTFDTNYYNPDYDIPSSHGTTHISVVTQDGGAASLMTTVNLIFGSFVMEGVTGVIMNNEMDDFSTTDKPNAFGYFPSIKNRIAPRKRPLSSATPVIAVSIPDASCNTTSSGSGERILVAGASGGSNIITNVGQVVQRVLDHNMSLVAAVDAPRLHHQLLPAQVKVEDRMSEVVKKFLQDRGHKVVNYDDPGVVQVAARHANGTLQAVSDMRKKGQPAGY